MLSATLVHSLGCQPGYHALLTDLLIFAFSSMFLKMHDLRGDSVGIVQAADAYAFGILLWELYTCSRAWANLTHVQVLPSIAKLCCLHAH